MREDPTSPPPSSASSRLRPIDLLIVGLGVLLLADAAIETWPHAAIRWWVIGFAVVYAVVAALSLVRRVSSTTQSVLAVATLLLVIAATAWLPGGTTDGVRLFTLSTPRVLTLVAAIGVALAGFAIVQAPRVPVAVRAAVALIAVYGVASLGLGAVQGVPLRPGSATWRP